MKMVIFFEKYGFGNYTFEKLLTLEKFTKDYPGVQLESGIKKKVTYDLYAMIVDAEE